MLNREEIFEICLEDYTKPRYTSAIRAYCGTKDEIHDLMDRLCFSTTGAAVRYSETIEAVEYYDLDKEITHTMAGQTLPVLKPVEEICRFENILTNQYWNYSTHEGSTISCFASEIDVCQSLIAVDGGFERCVKASFADLRVYYHGVGWMSVSTRFKGFPGMVTFDGERVTAALFTPQMRYESDEAEKAMADIVDITKINLSVAVADILGEG